MEKRQRLKFSPVDVIFGVIRLYVKWQICTKNELNHSVLYLHLHCSFNSFYLFFIYVHFKGNAFSI